MFKKGVSIFTGLKDYSLDDNLKYLHLAHQEGYEIVFSSCHINEASIAIDELQKVIDETCRLGMKLSLDISKPMYDKLILPKNLYALRLDYGFSEEDMIQMTNTGNFKIELNASTVSKARLLKLIEKGLNPSNIRMSFNYYPKLHTAHSIDFCKEVVKFCHELNISVGAFLPSSFGKRPPMYEGLPSVEKHRKMELDLAIEEFKAIGVDEILFGDAYASIDELKTLSFHQTDHLLVKFIPYEGFDKFSYLEGTFKIRRDISPELLRISSKRTNDNILPFNTIERKKYDVTIDNDGFLRYKGEVNIVMMDLEKDERVNVVGKINTTEVVLKEIEMGKEFTFIK